MAASKVQGAIPATGKFVLAVRVFDLLLPASYGVVFPTLFVTRTWFPATAPDRHGTGLDGAMAACDVVGEMKASRRCGRKLPGTIRKWQRVTEEGLEVPGQSA